MKQLEKKFYSRTEIADVLDVNVNDNKHFKRNVENKLQKWGYGYEYSRKGVEITKQPSTAEEKLAEIIVRKYEMDIQIDVYGFACFISLLMEDEEFRAMPWTEREKVMTEEMGVSISFETMRKWCAKLIGKNMITKSADKSYWGTTVVDGEKVRFAVSGDEAAELQMAEYMTCRKQFVEDYISNALASGRKDYNTVKSEAWSNAFKELWAKFHTCYYGCSTLMLNAFGDETVEIYELVNEIRNGEVKEFAVVTYTAIVPVVDNKNCGFVF